MPFYAEFGIDPGTIAEGPGRLPFSAEAAAVDEALWLEAGGHRGMF